MVTALLLPFSSDVIFNDVSMASRLDFSETKFLGYGRGSALDGDIRGDEYRC